MIRHAEAEWKGSLKEGSGQVKTETGALSSAYSFRSRFEGGGETNPEELIAAAHAACFSMALSAALSAAGHVPTSVRTTAAVHLDKVEGGFAITKIEIDTTGNVPGLDAATFEKFAGEAKKGCPVSKALAATEIHLNAKLA
ncbi:MAG TPA: OsmC family protein [Bryobacteraceae bacterium]|jgi:osmotically inducible protein OsmC|nr:OsmC family protein [Bryobacteraceae bacterium]